MKTQTQTSSELISMLPKVGKTISVINYYAEVVRSFEGGFISGKEFIAMAGDFGLHCRVMGLAGISPDDLIEIDAMLKNENK
jgi:hypothetical protein